MLSARRPKARVLIARNHTESARGYSASFENNITHLGDDNMLTHENILFYNNKKKEKKPVTSSKK